jgi:hypothetical protein
VDVREKWRGIEGERGIKKEEKIEREGEESEEETEEIREEMEFEKEEEKDKTIKVKDNSSLLIITPFSFPIISFSIIIVEVPS